MAIDEILPDFDGDSNDRDRILKDKLGETIDQENLKFNTDKNSFELDVESTDPDYDHADPYDTAAPNGEDSSSEWDEANPIVGDEYDKDASLETDVDKLGMHIDNGSIVELDVVDEILAQTPEDKREDLDEEGYPKNDGKKFR